MRRVLASFVAVAALAALPAPVAALPPSAFGISDQYLHLHQDDPRLAALGLRRARLIVPWDLAIAGPPAAAGSDYAEKLRHVDAWMDHVIGRGMEVVVSFEHSIGAFGPSGPLPEATAERPQYQRAVRSFRKRYGCGRYPSLCRRGARGIWLTAWNEPNEPSQPTGVVVRPDGTVEPGSGNPARAALYWHALDRECRKPTRVFIPCRAVAGDLLDDAKLLPEAYLRSYVKALRGRPPVWAWHAYGAAYTRNPGLLPSLLRWTRARRGRSPELWLTEQGGVMQISGCATCPLFVPHPDERGAPDEAAQADDVRWLLDELLPSLPARDRPRVTRFYLYQWKGARHWDSGLVDFEDGHQRPSYCVFAGRLGRSNPYC